MNNKKFKPKLVVIVTATLLLAGCLGTSPEQFLAAAKVDIEKKNNGAAVIQLKNALQKNPSLPEARFLLGKTLFSSGDAAGAAIELDKASELGYSSNALIPLQAQVMLQQGFADKVIEQYSQNSPSGLPELSELKTTLALAYAATGKLKQARESIDAAIKANPKNLAAQLVNVRLLATNRQIDDALKAVDQVIFEYSDHSEAWQLKGDLLALNSDSGQATLKAYEEAVKYEKNNIAARAGILRLLLKQHNLDAADKQLREMQIIAPNHPQARFFATHLALERKDLKTAYEQSQALLKIAPNDGAALQLAGSVEFRRGEFLQAENHLKQAIQNAPLLGGARIMLARTYLRISDGKKALATLQPLLDSKEPSAESYAVAAEAKFLLGEVTAAEDYYSKAVKFNPLDFNSRAVLAVVQMGKGQVERGFDELRAIAAFDPGSVADLALISAHVRKKEFDSALHAIDALERKQPNQAVAAGLRGRLELMRLNRVQARQAFESALKIDPSYFAVLATLAAMDVEDKKPEDAVRRFERVLDMDPQNLLAHMAIIELRAKAGAGKDELVERLNKAIKQNPTANVPRLALIALRMGQKETKIALAAAQDGLSALPEDVALLNALARVQTAAGDINQALIAANKVVLLQANQPEPLLRVAELHLASKDSAASMQMLKRALTLKADFLPAQVMLAVLLRDSGRTADAFNIARSVQSQRPKEAAGFHLEGDLEFTERNFPAALSAYRKAFEKQPFTELAIKLHRTLLGLGKDDEAKRHETQWLIKRPKDAIFLYYLGEMAQTQNNFPQAQIRFGQVLKLQPDNAVAANNLAVMLDKGGQPLALEYAEKANALVPNQPAFLDTLAQIYGSAGRFEKALEVQKKVVALAPEIPFYQLNLARLYIKSGKKDLAAEELKKLAGMGEGIPFQAEVKRLQAAL